jgi:hypothetical protein
MDKRQLRQNIRNFLLTASLAELIIERNISLENGDTYRAECIEELIREES